MNKTIILLFSVFLTNTLISQSAEMGVGAIGLVVSDIEASEQFYTEILGMMPSGGFELSANWSRDAGMSNGRPFKVKIFRLQEHQAATTLKLAYFDEVSSREMPGGIDENPGVNYITFYYKSLDEVKKRILNASLPIIGEVERENYELLIVQDPNGVFVELIAVR